jgi:hypothetical protein
MEKELIPDKYRMMGMYEEGSSGSKLSRGHWNQRFH